MSMRKSFKRTISAICVVCMLLAAVGTLPVAVSADTAAGSVYAPDATAWGTQGNNNWYYMYKTAAGEYKEMNYYATSDIGWQAGNFASDPAALAEMFFISPTAFFTGELGSMPTYAFKAPSGGNIDLKVQTHGLSCIQMAVYLNDRLIQVGGNDAITFVTTGGLPGGMTETTVNLDVKKNDYVYLVCSTTDANTRQGWVNLNQVSYITVNDEVALEKTYIPDATAWGTQGNNNWYYMYKTAAGEYNNMNYYATSDIGWQAGNFASDPAALAEMFFISPTAFFTGELGSMPTYAFKAPSGGNIDLKVQTHGLSCIQMAVYLNDRLIQVGGNDAITFVTTGGLPGGMTETTVNLDVKKNDYVYLVCSTTDANTRQGWVNLCRVDYNSYNDEVRLEKTYAPNYSNWGLQGNNNWYYMYKTTAGEYNNMNYYTTSDIGWQVGNFASDPFTVGEMFFIDKVHFFTGELGSMPTYAFKAPGSGIIEFTFLSHGTDSLGVRLYRNNKLVQINGADELTFVTTGSLPGGMTETKVSSEALKDDMFYFVTFTKNISAMRDGWFKDYRADYSVFYDEYAEAELYGSITDLEALDTDDTYADLISDARELLASSDADAVDAMKEDLVDALKVLRAPDAPVIQLGAITSGSISVIPADGCEYAIDNEEFGTASTFSGLLPYSLHTIKVRFAETDTAYASEVSSTEARTLKAAVGDMTVTVSGTERYRSVLTAAVESAPDGIGEINYNWYRNDELIGSDAEYTLTADDIGHSIRVTASSDALAETVTGDPTGIIGKCILSADEYTVPVAEKSIQYPQTLESAGLINGSADIDGVWSYVNGSSKPVHSQSGTRFPVIFTPAQPELYESVSATVQVTIDEAPYEPYTYTNETITISGDIIPGGEAVLTTIPGGSSAYIAMLRLAAANTDSRNLIFTKLIEVYYDGSADGEFISDGGLTLSVYIGEQYSGETFTLWFFINGRAISVEATADSDGIVYARNLK